MIPVAEVEDSDASLEDVMIAVCARFDVGRADLVGPRRDKRLALARHIAMYLCKTRLRYNPSFPEIGRAFGNRDHTSVMSAVRKIEALRTESEDVSAHVLALEKAIGCVPVGSRRRLAGAEAM